MLVHPQLSASVCARSLRLKTRIFEKTQHKKRNRPRHQNSGVLPRDEGRKNVVGQVPAQKLVERGCRYDSIRSQIELGNTHQLNPFFGTKTVIKLLKKNVDAIVPLYRSGLE